MPAPTAGHPDAVTETRLRRRLAGSQAHWTGGLFTASDARAEPWVALPRAGRRARSARGVTVIEGCAVRALDRAGGRLTGVVTEQGRIACEQVVVAGGAWSSLFARAEGIRSPQLSVLASVAATEPMAEIFPGAAADNDFAFRRRREDGGYSLAPGARARLLHRARTRCAMRSAYLPVLKKDWRSTHFRADGPDAAIPTPGPRRAAGRRTSPRPFEAVRILNPTPNMGALGRVQDAFARAFPALGRPRLQARPGPG